MNLREVLSGDRPYRVTIVGYGAGHSTLCIDLDDGAGSEGRMTIALVRSIDLPTSPVVCRLLDKPRKKDRREPDEEGRLRAIEMTDELGHQYEIVYGGYWGLIDKSEDFDDPLWEEGPPLSQL